MSRFLLAAALLSACACTPTYDWREVPIEPTELHATFPCKPDRAEHAAPIAPGRALTLHAVGCEAGGATFAVLWGDLGSGTEVADTLVQWKKASLATTHATVTSDQPYAPRGALGLADSSMTRSTGQRPDGRTLESQSAYFARGTRVYQAVVHASKLKPEMTEAFFAGLRFE